MSLPKWIHDAFGRSFECSDGEKLEQALEIAWEALDRNVSIFGYSDDAFDQMREGAKEAMRCIEEIGK